MTRIKISCKPWACGLRCPIKAIDLECRSDKLKFEVCINVKLRKTWVKSANEQDTYKNKCEGEY